MRVFYFYPLHLSGHDLFRQSIRYPNSITEHMFAYDNIREHEHLRLIQRFIKDPEDSDIVIFHPSCVWIQDITTIDSNDKGNRKEWYGKDGVYCRNHQDIVHMMEFSHYSDWDKTGLQMIDRSIFTTIADEERPPSCLVVKSQKVLSILYDITMIRPIGNQFMTYFHDVYVITVPKRRKRVERILRGNHLYPHAKIVDAVIAKQITDSDKKWLNKGQIACFLSHVKAYREFLMDENAGEFLFIMEDDVYFPTPFHVRLDGRLEWIGDAMHRLMMHFDKQWDLFYWGYCWETTFPWPSTRIRRLERPMCTHAFMVKRSVLRRYFGEDMKSVQETIDSFWTRMIRHDGLEAYGVHPPTIYQNPNCSTTIGYPIHIDRHLPPHVLDMLPARPSTPSILLVALLLIMIIVLWKVRLWV